MKVNKLGQIVWKLLVGLHTCLRIELILLYIKLMIISVTEVQQ